MPIYGGFYASGVLFIIIAIATALFFGVDQDRNTKFWFSVGAIVVVAVTCFFAGIWTQVAQYNPCADTRSGQYGTAACDDGGS